MTILKAESDIVLYYIIDGYNLMHKIPGLINLELHQAREELLDLIKVYNLCGKNKVTVVFDGRSDVVAPHHKTKFIVLFSEGESADSLIIRLASKMDNPKNVRVVTDDKSIARKIRQSDARHLSIANFLKKSKNKRKGSANRHNLNQDELEDITQEFHDKWIKENDTHKRR
jgi:predicted RNA-binding protein with PIN domain